MRKIYGIALLSLCLSTTVVVDAQHQPQPQQKEQAKKTVKNNSNQDSTEVYYFTKNKLSEEALRKKILKLSGVKDVQINLGGSSITVKFDSKKNTKDKLKKSFNKWGTPGDFEDRKSGHSTGKNTYSDKNRSENQQRPQGEKH